MEVKCQTFAQWQEQRTSVEKRREYLSYCKEVRKAVRADKERYWEEVMNDLEEDIKRNRQGDFFKKLSHLSGNSRALPDSILDEAGQLVQ